VKNKGLVIIALLVLVAGFFFAKKYFKDRDSSAPHSNDEYQIKLEEDRGILKKFKSGSFAENGTGPDAFLVYGAMIRLGEVKDALAYEVAVKESESQENLYREAAAQTLGYYPEDEATEILVKLLGDRETSVKEFAAKGLGKAQDPKRLEKVRELLSAKNIPNAQRLPLLASYYQLASDDAKAWALSQIVKMTSETEIGDDAALLMVQIAPESPSTTQVLQSKIEAGESVRVIGVGIRHLASQQDPWLPQNLARLSAHKSPLVRKAVIQSLHRNCPANRWDLMKKISSAENDKSVIEVTIREAAVLSGHDAQAFLDSLKKAELHPEALALLTEAKAQIAKNSASPCP